MAAAIPRLSDSERPGIGIVTRLSTPARTSAGRPWASLPNTSASGGLRSTRSGRSPPRAAAAMRLRPRSPSTPSTSWGSQPSTTGTWKSAPAEARTVFGLVTSTEPRQKITPWAPAASALRIRVPPLPGSRTSTPTTRSLGSAPWPAATSARPGGRRRATASTGWGVTVPAPRARTPGAGRWSMSPRRPAPPASAGPVDPHDPQPAELALADPAVAEGVDAGVHDLLVGGLEAAAPRAAVALGRLEDGAAVLLPVDGALDPGHDDLSPSCSGAYRRP